MFVAVVSYFLLKPDIHFKFFASLLEDPNLSRKINSSMRPGFSSAPISKTAKSKLEKYRVSGIEKAELMMTCLLLL
jgi:hypothetical protein